MDTKQVSKYLSYILRHRPDTIKLQLDQEGWAEINELIEKTIDFKLTKQLIENIVKENDKQRFIIKDNKIRANQGHSININLALEPKQPPSVLYHGTATKFINSIKQSGLKPKTRQFVHLSTDQHSAYSVGQRHGKPIILIIDSFQMYQDGYEFFLSDNKVWLIIEVPWKYIHIQS
jgi:putative RNA 2'-phosphotransferase